MVANFAPVLQINGAIVVAFLPGADPEGPGARVGWGRGLKKSRLR